MLRSTTGLVAATLVAALCVPIPPAVAAVEADRSGGIPVADLFPGARFDPRVPSQAQVLGFHPGARPLRHDELIRYLERLAEESPRVQIETYATTHEGRPMVYLTIGDEATVRSHRRFREQHAARVDPRGRPASEDAALLADAKAVAWMAYSIHGDELSGTDAAAAVAYWLAAGEDPLATSLRRELVVLIDPCENPDGRDRFLAQTRSFAHAKPNPDPEDLSHTTVWPWGRGNHYLFDLNRDWFSMVQPESRRSQVISSWLPQLMVDAHEMGSSDTYLFSPPRHPFNPLLPEYGWRWADVFAADQAKALDARGYGYYTREWNEEFFPGYGSSWPAYQGAIGILYEMSSTDGTLVRQRGGTLRSFAQAVEHQVASSIANLRTLADNRADVLREYVAARREIVAAGKSGPFGAWVLVGRRDPERVRSLVRLLRRQGIEVLRAEDDTPRVSGLRDARTGASVDASDLEGEAWLVPLDQPSGALARVLLDPHVPMESTFLAEEREYVERGKGTRLYEITAWSLALALDVDTYWTARRPDAGWMDARVDQPAGDFQSGSAPFGYVVHGDSDRSMFALADLLQRGLAVRVADKPFEVDGRRYERGAILIRREGNPEDLAQQLVDVSARWKTTIRAVPTAKATSGPDLGGRHFPKLQPPRIGVWSGMGVSPSAYGALWHLLDREVDQRFTALDVGRFERVDLQRYNVLVFPPVFGGYDNLIDDAGVERLASWVRAGGTAIGIGGGAAFLSDEDHELTRTRLRSQALQTFPPVVLGAAPEQAAAAGLFRAAGVRAPEKPDDAAAPKSKPRATAGSPYDVAPLIGAGARPFAEGVRLGTSAAGEPVDLSDWLRPFLPPGKSEPDEEQLARADERLRRFATYGTFVRVELDEELWLAWGSPAEIPVLVRARDALVAVPPVQVPARYADVERLHLGGLLWPETAGRLAHTAYATREAVGRGQVILFLSEPEFRGWTLGTRRLLLNALLYGPGLGTRWSSPW